MPSVSVIIVNYHGLEDTIACVQSLQTSRNTENLKIIVVNADDDSAERSKSTQVCKTNFKTRYWSARIWVFWRKQRGCRIHITESQSGYLLFLNNDTEWILQQYMS